MSRDKSFFERLTGTVNLNDDASKQPNTQPEGRPNNQSPTRQQPQQPEKPQPNQPKGNQGDFAEPQNTNTQPAGQQRPEDEWGQPQPEKSEETGELAVDVYETPNHVIIQTMVAGVRPEKLDVSISREQCTVSGRRQPPRDVPHEDYYHQELYWGAFSRTVSLPVEIDVESAEADESHGLLTITLPKIDKHQETTLEINSTQQ